jgi:hypothetical protein
LYRAQFLRCILMFSSQIPSLKNPIMQKGFVQRQKIKK